MAKFFVTDQKFEHKRHFLGDADANDLIYAAPLKMLRDLLQSGALEEGDTVSVAVHNQDSKELRATWSVQEIRKELHRRLSPVN